MEMVRLESRGESTFFGRAVPSLGYEAVECRYVDHVATTSTERSFCFVLASERLRD